MATQEEVKEQVIQALGTVNDPELGIDNVAMNLYRVTGQGGNTAVFVRNDGTEPVVVMDSAGGRFASIGSDGGKGVVKKAPPTKKK